MQLQIVSIFNALKVSVYDQAPTNVREVVAGIYNMLRSNILIENVSSDERIQAMHKAFNSPLR